MIGGYSSVKTGTLAADRTTYILVDETGNDTASDILAVVAVVCDELESVRRSLRNLREDVESDPALSQLRSVRRSLPKRGFHFTDDHSAVRKRVLAVLAELPYDAYVCFATKNNVPCDTGFGWYDRLLGRLLFDRLRDNVQNDVSIVVERDPSGHRNRVQSVIARVVGDIESRGRSFEQPPRVTIAGKEELALAVPDYVAGTFRTGAHHAATEDQRAALVQLKPRLRLVHDYSNDRFYHRRDPIPDVGLF